MGIFHDKIRNTIYITQQQYIESIVELFRKYGISEFRTPMDERQHYSKSQMPKDCSAEAQQMATLPYRELIGSLLWVYIPGTLAKGLVGAHFREKDQMKLKNETVE